jgi:hypothetical protein
MTTSYRICQAVGTYKIDSRLHESIKLNPGKFHYLRVSLSATVYRNVVTVIRVKVDSMKSLHEKITNLKALYQKEWGVPPDEVIVSRG